MSCSCFIHSSVNGPLGSFHILAIVNNAAMNIGVLMFFQISILYILEINLCLRYLLQIYFTIQLVPFSFFWWFLYAEAFYFDEVPFVYSFFYVPCSRGHYQWKYCCVKYPKFPYPWSPLRLLWCCDLYLSLLSILSLFLYMVYL